jgi:hypothetical protein
MKHAFITSSLLASIAISACDDGAGDDPADAGAPNTDAESIEGADADIGEDAEAPRVGFEILHIVGPTEIVVWLGLDVTQADFDALELPSGWFANQPREGVPDSARFFRSPDADTDGVFTDEQHFGFNWRHNATVVETNIALDEDGLLSGTRVAKYHELTYVAGRTVPVLTSPEGDRYILVSRDANRTSEIPTIPMPWVLTEVSLDEDLTTMLPNPTLNIRCDNQDSFQGPVLELLDL